MEPLDILAQEMRGVADEKSLRHSPAISLDAEREDRERKNTDVSQHVGHNNSPDTVLFLFFRLGAFLRF